MSTFKHYQPLAYCPDGTYLPFDGPKDTLEEAWESIDSSLGKNGLPLSRTKYVVLTILPDARVAPQSKQDDGLYYADSESQKTNMREVVPPMLDDEKSQDPQVTWEPVVKVYAGIRGFDNGAVPHRVDTWRLARRVSCPHCGMQSFYRSIEEGTQELSPEGNIYCLYCKKIFHWPLAQNDELVQGKVVDTPSIHYEAYKQEDLGEWMEPVAKPTIPCAHLIAAEKALYDNGIGINLYGEVDAFCYHCKQNMPIEGPVIGVPNSVAWKRQR